MQLDLEHTLVLPPAAAVVLHYESTHYSRWRDKFCDYAERVRFGIADTKARTFNTFYRNSIATCTQLIETNPLIVLFSAADAEEQACSFWRDAKVEPEGLPAAAEGEMHVIDKLGVTLFPPPAAGVRPAPSARTTSTAGGRVDGEREVLPHEVLPPSAKHWRVVHKQVWVRSAPGMHGTTIGVQRQGDLVAVDGEVDNATGRWVRVADSREAVFRDGGGWGWMLTDGTKLGLGLGRLLAPLAEQLPPPGAHANVVAMAATAAGTATAAAVTAAVATALKVPAKGEAGVAPLRHLLGQLIELAGLPDSTAAKVAGPLSDTCDTLEELSRAAGHTPIEYLEELARSAKLPVGHRLRLCCMFRQTAGQGLCSANAPG